VSDYSSFAVPKPVKRVKAQKRRKPLGARADRVDDSLRVEVLKRDGVCFLRTLYEDHVCFDKFDEQHASTDLDKLEVDHFWLDGAHMGDRAPSDLAHLVAMCHWANVIHKPTREERAAERDYSRRLYPDAHD
jgi:hypothetical protein